MKKEGIAIIMILLLAMLSSCASLGMQPEWKYEKDAISLYYRSDSYLNIYQGNPHTLMLCVYQLRDPNAFNQLLGEEEELSKLLECSRFDPSVTSAKRLTIYPGKEKTESLDRAENTKYVGIVAGYYSLKKERAVRLYEVPLSPFLKHPKNLKIRLYLGAQEIHMIEGK
jgi:type VI secretion system VasD/TssJ family lipoprotein